MKFPVWLRYNLFYRILFLTLGGVLILGQFGRFELGAGRALYFQDITLVLFLGLYCYEYRSRSLRSLVTTLGRPFLLFLSWIIITSLIQFMGDTLQLVTAVLYTVRFACIVVFGSILSNIVKRRIVSMHELSQWLIGVPVAIAVLGLMQYAIYPDTRSLQLLGWDDHYYRLISTIFDPGFTGIIVVLGSVVVLNAWLTRKSWFHATWYLLLSVSLLLTYSRASYVAFLVGTTLLLLYKRAYTYLFLLPILAICVLFLPRPGGEGVRLERTASVVARIESVDQALADFGPAQMLIGKGWYWQKAIRPTSTLRGQIVPNHSVAAENSAVFIISALGIVGLGLYTWWIGGYVLRMRGSALWFAAFVAIVAHSLFTNTLFYPLVLIYLMVLTVRSEQELL